MGGQAPRPQSGIPVCPIYTTYGLDPRVAEYWLKWGEFFLLFASQTRAYVWAPSPPTRLGRGTISLDGYWMAVRVVWVDPVPRTRATQWGQRSQRGPIVAVVRTTGWEGQKGPCDEVQMCGTQVDSSCEGRQICPPKPPSKAREWGKCGTERLGPE